MLTGCAFSLQRLRLRFGFRFGLLDLENLVGFAAGLGRDEEFAAFSKWLNEEFVEQPLAGSR